jgi:molybdopterin molybdotransferase
VRVDGTEIVLLGREASRNIRFRGEDARAGSTLVSERTVLSPGALALLASLGHLRPLVTRRPRVLHLATGNEIVPPDQTPQRGQVRDSNSTLVRAFLGQWGIAPNQLHTGEDEAAAKSEVLCPKSGIAEADLLLVSGGASVGEDDFTRRLLEELGFTIHVSHTTTRPGKPLIFATRGPVVAFGLPGNPLAHFVCLNLYVRAALDALQGRPAGPAFACGVLGQELHAKANARETLWPAHWALAHGNVELTPLPWRSSGDLTALATANALVRILPGCGTLPRGTVIEFVATAPSA